MSDRVSCWYFKRCVLVGSSSNVDVDFKRWYFSCDGQQRALRDSEATTFCEQEPAVGFASVFLSGYRNYVVLISWNNNVLGATFSDSCWSRYCSSQWFSSNSRRKTDLLEVRVEALDSSCYGVSSYTTFGGCDWLEAKSRSCSNMPPRRRGRGRGQFQDDSGGQNEDQHSFPSRGRGRRVEDEVDDLADMEPPSVKYSVSGLIDIQYPKQRALRDSEATTFCEQEPDVGFAILILSRCVVPEKSNAIIGVVTTGFECLPPSCDGLTGSEDHGPMISPVNKPCGYRG
ncbi:hypothetical protein F511_31928 [Dorcoceras hygrometricum]|uniref:Uncharacterized protein n=1 Tax=Dorcoceras hygrometricum TaxID=472368 RepID=A0A2Z7B8R3_9LAMI|nr:hypothetical protein F511_31928 [Dorcoceras hygrometricum]